MLLLNQVPEKEYADSFDEIFEWFHHNVHLAWENYNYDIRTLDRTFLKLIDLSTERNVLHFRVLLKATYNDVRQPGVPPVDPWEISSIQQKQTNKEVVAVSALQVCYIQLDGNNTPVGGVLFTYSEGKFHRFELGE